MTYYEELGVAPSASSEEIHQAYKALARLLHPDQCPDARLRGLAELQMKRLNQVLAVLADPLARNRYDAALAGRLLLPLPPRPLPARLSAAWHADPRLWACTAAAALALAALGFLAGHAAAPAPTVPAAAAPAAPPPPPPAAPAPRRAARREAALAAEASALRRELAALHAEHDRLLDRLARAAAPAHPWTPPDPPRLAPAPALPAAAPQTAPAPGPAPPPANPEPRPPGLAGNWFYVPSLAPPGDRMYAPEYIELRLTGSGGLLRGRYRARYKVTDRAISPLVSFEFEGRAAAPAATLPWTAPGGARGQVVLRLLSDHSLEVSWKAYQLDADLGLASGTATLIRQREP